MKTRTIYTREERNKLFQSSQFRNLSEISIHTISKLPENCIGKIYGVYILYVEDEFKEMVAKKLKQIKENELHNNTNK